MKFILSTRGNIQLRMPIKEAKIKVGTVASYPVEDALILLRIRSYDEEDEPIRTWEEFKREFCKIFYSKYVIEENVTPGVEG